jgi:selenocysteine-specific elongation factor
MRVIGTAGHVDHGKSTLIEALTGTHPDRLKEEQAREMTIELGFGWLALPNGEEVGIVDVPGHRDFIENMLSGIGGIDAALLVIAADEGVMPQTKGTSCDSGSASDSRRAYRPDQDRPRLRLRVA